MSLRDSGSRLAAAGIIAKKVNNARKWKEKKRPYSLHHTFLLVLTCLLRPQLPVKSLVTLWVLYYTAGRTEIVSCLRSPPRTLDQKT